MSQFALCHIIYITIPQFSKSLQYLSINKAGLLLCIFLFLIITSLRISSLNNLYPSGFVSLYLSKSDLLNQKKLESKYDKLVRIGRALIVQK